MNGSMAAAAAAATVCGALAPAALAQRATFQGLGHLPGGAESHANAVSADGRAVVGRAVGAEGPAAVRWTRRTGLQILEPLPGWGGAGWNWVATAASADGSAIAGLGVTPADDRVAFRWTAPTGMQDLGDLPGGEVTAEARGISGDGSIVVGNSHAAHGEYSYPTAFRWTEAGGMQSFLPLPAFTWAYGISIDGKTIVGHRGANGYHWTEAEGMRMFEIHAVPLGVSGDGEVAVGDDSSWPGAFRWLRESGKAEGLGLLEWEDSGATAASGDGSVIVGWSLTSYRTPPRAVLYRKDGTAEYVQDVLAVEYGLDLSGWELRVATGVSADGTVIVGSGINPAGHEEGWVARFGDGPCYPDCDASGEVDFFDYLCYQGSFAAAEPWADCDGSGALNLFDFLCFQNAFATGCP